MNASNLPISKPNILLEKLASGQVLHMAAINHFGSAKFMELLCGTAEIDAVWLDVEHGVITDDDLYTLNLAARGFDVSVFARVAPTDYRTLMRPLEAGLEGVMAAMVQSAAQAAEIVSWVKFNVPGGEFPNGRRGYNPLGPDGFYGTIGGPEYGNLRNKNTYLMIQIETVAALEDVEAIAQVKGVDGLFFGPGDFSQAAGVFGDFLAPVCQKAMDRVAAAAKAAGKWWASLGHTPELYKAVRGRGARIIYVGGDASIINAGINAMNKYITLTQPSPGTGEGLS